MRTTDMADMIEMPMKLKKKFKGCTNIQYIGLFRSTFAVVDI